MDWNELLLWLFGGGTVLSIIAALLISSLCTLLPIAAVGFLLYKGWKNRKQKELDSQTWISTTGEIIKSRVEVSGGEYTSVSPKIVYKYRVGENEYTCDEISFSVLGRNESAYETVDRYPEGMSVTVYYNPDNPNEATLER